MKSLSSNQKLVSVMLPLQKHYFLSVFFFLFHNSDFFNKKMAIVLTISKLLQPFLKIIMLQPQFCQQR